MVRFEGRYTDEESYTIFFNGESKGQLIFKNAFSSTAEIRLGSEAPYHFTPKGFWGSTIELRKEDALIAKLKMNWNGQMIIKTYQQDKVCDYALTHLGFFKNSFLLSNRDKQELVHVSLDSKWNMHKANYEFQCADCFQDEYRSDLLLFIVLYCAKYYYTQMSAAIAASA